MKPSSPKTRFTTHGCTSLLCFWKTGGERQHTNKDKQIKRNPNDVSFNYSDTEFDFEDSNLPAADSNQSHKVMKFQVLQASVRAYFRNLNTHSSYRDFRKFRAAARDNNEKLDSLSLADYLDQYAATGVKYTEILKKIIKQNSLKDFDDVKLLPNSELIKKII